MSDLFTGKIFQTNDETGEIAGDICMTSSWSDGSKAVLTGRTTGNKYTLSIALDEEIIGSLEYSKLPYPVNGLIALGKLTLGEAVIKTAVFRKEKAVLTADSSAKVVYHSFRGMTPEEVTKYSPKPRAMGSMM